MQKLNITQAYLWSDVGKPNFALHNITARLRFPLNPKGHGWVACSALRRQR